MGRSSATRTSLPWSVRRAHYLRTRPIASVWHLGQPSSTAASAFPDDRLCGRLQPLLRD